MKKSLMEEALSISRRKQSLHPERKRYCHYSFIVQDNKIVEYGWNHAGQPKLHYGYVRKNRTKTFRPKTHSEASAYFKARGLLDKSRTFDIINIRLSRSGELRNSKPCECCAELLTALGCRCFYFTINTGFRKIRF